MSKFLQIASKIDVLPLLLELERQPFLWNKNPFRLSKYGPHHETQDIFLRYKDEAENLKSDFKNFSDPHIAEWYRSINFLPSAKPLIFELMYRVKAELLGGVFIYKVEPGKQIYPHIDRGWHPEFYDKFNICLQSNGSAFFKYDDCAMYQRQGDVHWFRNDVEHSVMNKGTNDHIVMTVCVRLDRQYRASWSPEGFTMDSFLERK